MSSQFMRQAATVLEKIAEHLDQEEIRQQIAKKEERLKIASALGEKYTTATGEELTTEMLEHIATADNKVLHAFEKLATRIPHNTPPDTMGEGGNIDDVNTAVEHSRRKLEKTAEADASQQFLNWILE